MRVQNCQHDMVPRNSDDLEKMQTMCLFKTKTE